MERTQRAEFLAGALQIYLLANDLDDVRATAYFIDDILRDHRAACIIAAPPP
jgi:hypothetical protein